MDRLIAALAEAQHGVVSLAQLRALGMTASAVRMRVAAGKLHRVHYGVYAVGHPLLTPKGHLMAAVLACGEGSMLSHQTAGAHLNLRPTQRAKVDVTAPGRSGKSRTGIQVHSAKTITPADVTVMDRIPCTTWARTLLDLAEVLHPRAVEKACDRAEQLKIFDLRALDDVLRRADGRRGARVLHEILRSYRIGEDYTRNDLEDALLAICPEAGVPPPRVNYWIPLPGGDVEGDFVWVERKLIVETDGDATHGTHQGRENDHRRDRRLRKAGWQVERFTWREVFHDRARVVRELREIYYSN
jgi:hypothetical protein